MLGSSRGQQPQHHNQRETVQLHRPDESHQEIKEEYVEENDSISSSSQYRSLYLGRLLTLWTTNCIVRKYTLVVHLTAVVHARIGLGVTLGPRIIT